MYTQTQTGRERESECDREKFKVTLGYGVSSRPAVRPCALASVEKKGAAPPSDPFAGFSTAH